MDRFLPQGDQLLRPLAVALSVTLTDLAVTPLQLPDDKVASAVDRALGVSDNDRTFPLSLIAGLVMDVAALLVGAPLAGPFASPFANANFQTKARAFELVEQPAADLLAVFDNALPQPLRGSGAGLLRFVGGICSTVRRSPCGASIGSTTTPHGVSRRPVSWNITGYRPNGLVDGHDDFIGYYKGFEEF